MIIYDHKMEIIIIYAFFEKYLFLKNFIYFLLFISALYLLHLIDRRISINYRNNMIIEDNRIFFFNFDLVLSIRFKKIYIDDDEIERSV